MRKQILMLVFGLISIAGLFVIVFWLAALGVDIYKVTSVAQLSTKAIIAIVIVSTVCFLIATYLELAIDKEERYQRFPLRAGIDFKRLLS